MEKRIFNFYAKIEFPEQMRKFLLDSEEIKFSVKTIRDVAVFTDRRVLIADKQGITGKKIEYYSLPFKNVITYAIETAGTFDLDSEIKLVLAGGIEVELKFLRDPKLNELLFDVYHLINNFVLTR